MNNLHPGVRWLYRLKAYGSLVIVSLFVTVYLFQIFKFISGGSLGIGLAIAILFYFSFIIALSEIYARMSYNRFLYEITNEGIKIEQGIIWKKYTSIPYERVQNVDIQRGIIARMLGFSTVQIETAGQSGMNSHYGFKFGNRNREYKSEGYLPAIDSVGAEEMRAFIMKQIKHRHATRSGGV